jgi:hypothetical protein
MRARPPAATTETQYDGTVVKGGTISSVCPTLGALGWALARPSRRGLAPIQIARHLLIGKSCPVASESELDAEIRVILSTWQSLSARC